MLILDTLRAHDFLNQTHDVADVACGKQQNDLHRSFHQNAAAMTFVGHPGTSGASCDEGVDQESGIISGLLGISLPLPSSPTNQPSSSSSSSSSSSTSSPSTSTSLPSTTMHREPWINVSRRTRIDRKTTYKRRIRKISASLLQQGSLYAQILKYCGTSLFTRPILWTDLHVKVLDAHFIELAPCDTPVPDNVPSNALVNPSSIALLLSRKLGQLLSPDTRPRKHQYCISTILGTCFPGRNFASGRHMAPFMMYFDGIPYPAICATDVVWCEGSNRRPRMAYIAKSVLRERRETAYAKPRQAPNKSNDAVANLIRLKTAKMMPKDEATDPYLVGLFIAMAQHHFYGYAWQQVKRLRSGWEGVPRETPKFRDVKLRIMTGDNEEQLSVYTATVTAALLARFHDAKRSPKHETSSLTDTPGLKIEHTKVKAWPILGFKERLGKALGKDFVGEFSEDAIERWPESPQTEPESDGEVLPTRTSPTRHQIGTGDSQQPQSASTDRVTDQVENGRTKRRRLS